MEKKISVFEVLNAINVNEHTEKKNGITYLSWAWAWAELKKRCPDATYTIYENKDGLNYHHDGCTAWVKTGVTAEGIEMIEMLPIMDFKNKSIPLGQITSFDVNKAIQRSLTKAEKEHITKWKDVYKITSDMLEYAYELTANSASKPSIAYMSRILDRWYAQGITTLQQAKDSEINFKKTKEKPDENNDSSFDTDEFFNAALQRSYSNIGKKPTSNQ